MKSTAAAWTDLFPQPAAEAQQIVDQPCPPFVPSSPFSAAHMIQTISSPQWLKKKVPAGPPAIQWVVLGCRRIARAPADWMPGSSNWGGAFF